MDDPTYASDEFEDYEDDFEDAEDNSDDGGNTADLHLSTLLPSPPPSPPSPPSFLQQLTSRRPLKFMSDAAATALYTRWTFLRPMITLKISAAVEILNLAPPLSLSSSKPSSHLDHDTGVLTPLSSGPWQRTTTRKVQTDDVLADAVVQTPRRRQASIATQCNVVIIPVSRQSPLDAAAVSTTAIATTSPPPSDLPAFSSFVQRIGGFFIALLKEQQQADSIRRARAMTTTTTTTIPLQQGGAQPVVCCSFKSTFAAAFASGTVVTTNVQLAFADDHRATTHTWAVHGTPSALCLLPLPLTAAAPAAAQGDQRSTLTRASSSSEGGPSVLAVGTNQGGLAIFSLLRSAPSSSPSITAQSPALWPCWHKYTAHRSSIGAVCVCAGAGARTLASVGDELEGVIKVWRVEAVVRGSGDGDSSTARIDDDGGDKNKNKAHDQDGGGRRFGGTIELVHITTLLPPNHSPLGGGSLGLGGCCVALCSAPHSHVLLQARSDGSVLKRALYSSPPAPSELLPPRWREWSATVTAMAVFPPMPKSIGGDNGDGGDQHRPPRTLVLVGRANGSVSLFDVKIRRAIAHLEPLPPPPLQPDLNRRRQQQCLQNRVVALVWQGPWRLGCFACLRADGSLVVYDICASALSLSLRVLVAPPTSMAKSDDQSRNRVVHCTDVVVEGHRRRCLALLMQSGEVVIRKGMGESEEDEEASRYIRDERGTLAFPLAMDSARLTD